MNRLNYIVYLFIFNFYQPELKDYNIVKTDPLDIKFQDCGVERWAIKTLSDPDTIKINFLKNVPSTIHKEISLKRPSIERNKRHETETTVLKINCNIVGFKRENGDKDIHVIIEDDDTEETMVAEIPSHKCTAIIGTSRKNQFFDLNYWFVENIGYPSNTFKYLKKHIPVTITGIGFFDKVHGQVGMATNGREIHPILTIVKRK